MRYLQENLLADEKIIYFTRPHWIVFFPPVFAAILAIGFFLFGKDFFITDYQFMGYRYYDILAVTAAVMSVYFLLSAWITYATSEYGVTNKRVLMKTGLIRRNSLELFLDKIEAIHVEQSIPGRVLDYGTLIIIGTGGTQDPFYFVPRPITFRKRVQQQIDVEQNYRKRNS